MRFTDGNIVAEPGQVSEVVSPDARGGVIPDLISWDRLLVRVSPVVGRISVCDDHPVNGNASMASRNSGRTVLIVDDHDGFRMSARRMLEREGYRVLGEAVDGRSGIEQAQSLRPDIALVDIRLPDIDGFEVAYAIRATGSAKLIVLISTRPRTDHGDRLVKSSADGFIEKSELSARAIAAIVGGSQE
jgi:CheY-like chemotaxis protein